MGATVIKVEAPESGDPIRFGGSVTAGVGGFGFLHLRWNRGKRSVALDLKRPEGVDLFGQLAARAGVVIEGMRGGVLDRLGLGYESLRALNPAVVFCSVSGFGLSGPYHTMGSHGPSFDGFGGLMRVLSPSASAPPSVHGPRVSVGMYAVSLYAALGTLAALRKAERTGEGSLIEVAAADCSAHWVPGSVDVELNRDAVEDRPHAVGPDGKVLGWPRLDTYTTGDDRVIMVQLLVERSWRRFCAAVDRPDLLEIYDRNEDPISVDGTVRRELTTLFSTRSLEQWMDLFLQHDIWAVPVNSFSEILEDPHFLARSNVYEPEGTRECRLTGTPVKVHGQEFRPRLAPGLGDETDEVLVDHLGLGADEIAVLRAKGVIR
jgi:crotonobetainyl-CoA:carnitine CoA-transferase CaiB-like acyl-CoA transferase